MKTTIKAFDRDRPQQANREFSTVLGALKCAITENYDAVATFRVREDGSHQLIPGSLIAIPEYYRTKSLY